AAALAGPPLPFELYLRSSASIRGFCGWRSSAVSVVGVHRRYRVAGSPDNLMDPPQLALILAALKTALPEPPER
ncbi:MAG: hypothetical protein K6T86_22000, partial [Pirellulales bacterium]|nr:hypothetical protein [Pirellulales bacterium]